MKKIYDITIEDIHQIKTLWEKNRVYHEATSEYFGEAYKGICFEDRMTKFEKMLPDTYRISLYQVDDELLGYCISTAANGVGEIESIHVDESQRGKGIGQELAEDHLKWMAEKQCKSIGVTVSQENKATIGFYRKLGFYPNTIFMEQK